MLIFSDDNWYTGVHDFTVCIMVMAKSQINWQCRQLTFQMINTLPGCTMQWFTNNNIICDATTTKRQQTKLLKSSACNKLIFNTLCLQMKTYKTSMEPFYCTLQFWSVLLLFHTTDAQDNQSALTFSFFNR